MKLVFSFFLCGFPFIVLSNDFLPSCFDTTFPKTWYTIILDCLSQTQGEMQELRVCKAQLSPDALIHYVHAIAGRHAYALWYMQQHTKNTREFSWEDLQYLLNILNVCEHDFLLGLTELFDNAGDFFNNFFQHIFEQFRREIQLKLPADINTHSTVPQAGEKNIFPAHWSIVKNAYPWPDYITIPSKIILQSGMQNLFMPRC